MNRQFHTQGGCGGMVSMILIAIGLLGFSVAHASGLDHPVTVGMVLIPALVIGGLGAGFAFLMFLVWLFNPFRSGH